MYTFVCGVQCVYVQLTLEQHGLEVCRSVSMWIFFNKCKYIFSYDFLMTFFFSSFYCKNMVYNTYTKYGSTDSYIDQLWAISKVLGESEVLCGFSTVQTPNPTLFHGHLLCINYCVVCSSFGPASLI